MKPNHFAARCWTTRCRNIPKQINALKEEEEVFSTKVAATTLDDMQFVNPELESGKHLRFRVDTGAQCNVLPVSLYKQATKDVPLT